MRRVISKFRETDNGVAMVWLATTLVLLLGTAGFAVDLGWLYLNTSRTQRSVDAAAMAGVVNLPGFPATADLEARDAARANGYDVCDPLQTGCADTLTSTPLTESVLEVTLSTTVNSFFLAVMGFDNFKITRTAKAEYVKPVPMGSPNRCFGRDPTGTYCTDDPNSFWAAVSAPYTLRENGDPYSTHCFTPSNSVNTCNTWNTDYARSGSYPGYYYAVEVGSGASNLTVRVYDPSHYERSNVNEETGDFRYNPGRSWGEPGVTTRYRFYNVDSTPSDPTDNPLVPGCDYTLTPDQYPGLENNWGTLCTIGGSHRHRVRFQPVLDSRHHRLRTSASRLRHQRHVDLVQRPQFWWHRSLPRRDPGDSRRIKAGTSVLRPRRCSRKLVDDSPKAERVRWIGHS